MTNRIISTKREFSNTKVHLEFLIYWAWDWIFDHFSDRKLKLYLGSSSVMWSSKFYLYFRSLMI